MKFRLLKTLPGKPHPPALLVREDGWLEDPATKEPVFHDGKADGVWYRFVFFGDASKRIYTSEPRYKPSGKTLAGVAGTMLDTLFPPDEWPRNHQAELK